jgi:hypothetical protein
MKDINRTVESVDLLNAIFSDFEGHSAEQISNINARSRERAFDGKLSTFLVPQKLVRCSTLVNAVDVPTKTKVVRYG